MLIRCAEKKSSVTACMQSIEYAKNHPDPVEAWAACERGDWLLWLAERAGVDRRRIASAAADIAELTLQRYWPAGSTDRRPHEAITTLRRWIAGEATNEELRLASEAAMAAAKASADASAKASALAAEIEAEASAWAAWTAAARASADAATKAAWAAAWAAEAAAWAAARAVADAVDVADAAADAARIDSLRESAEIVRRYLSIEDAIAAIGGAK
jgi:phage host-nuclease inhibitor protein Gam